MLIVVDDGRQSLHHLIIALGDRLIFLYGNAKDLEEPLLVVKVGVG